MFGLFQRKDRPAQEQAERLYLQVVAQARQPVFYTDYRVPDTVDGRFEMIALHSWLLIQKLHKDNAPNVAQALFDQMFLDMDRSMREMGIGDLSVPKKMKVMMSAFNGRSQAYAKAFAEPALLHDTVRRNIYGTLKIMEDATVTAMCEYVKAQKTYVDVQDLPRLLNGENIFISDQGVHHAAA